ncbi:MAG: arylsulfatase [Rhodospirillales bacterium]|jgi:Asp/Glu/hydantoin racemase|nr:arylsulfatase [Rhodospirillales bacterium]MDB5381250.1 arylsulfatase [Rhodospirillales bacterium]
MRIALIHALRHSPAAIGEAFARLWPEPKLMNLLDDSLSADLDRDGALTPAMFARFMTLSEYAVGTGADAILFTCSAFGPCIDAVVAAFPNIPVLKPNEAMIEEAKAAGTHIGLLATFAGTLRTMPAEFPPEITVTTKLAEGAMAALDAGNFTVHDFLAAKAALDLKDCDAIALGQFSLARAATAVATATGKPVLTTPDSAVLALRRRLLG